MTAATSSSPTPSSEQVIVSPGDLVYTKVQKAASNLLRGPGVYEDGVGNYRASFSGRVRQVERLIIVESLSLQPLAVGDVVVGRVAAVGNGKWSVEVGQPRLASLPLQAIHLPNNEQRRRTAEDYLNMREFFQEEDLLLAEVQRVLPDSGEIFLQTRSAKYGRLGKGMLVVCNEEAGLQLARREEGKSPGEVLDAAVPPIEAIFSANGWVFLRPCCTASGSKVETLNFSGRAAAGGSGDESSAASCSSKAIQAILACRTAVAEMLAQRQRLSVHALEQKGRDILKNML
eukprot:g12429.t1